MRNFLLWVLFCPLLYFAQDTICAGMPTTVSIVNSYSLSSPMYSMQPGGFGSNDGNFVVTPTVSTDYTLYCTGINSQSISQTYSSVVGVTVLPAPSSFSATTSSFEPCMGDTVTLSATGAASYSWVTGSTDSVIHVIMASNSAGYGVTGFGTNGCAAHVYLFIYANNGYLIINSTNSVSCDQQPVILTAVGAALTYSWNTQATTQTIQVQPATTSTYVVTSHDHTCTATASIVILAAETPSLNVSSTSTLSCDSDLVTLTVSGAAMFYSWNVPYNWTGQAVTNVQVRPTSTNTYVVTGFNYGCSSSDSIVVKVAACTGIHEFSGAELIQLFPNPAEDGQFTITNAEGLRYGISNALGQLVCTGTISGNAKTVSLNDYPDGIYNVYIYDATGGRAMKLIKQ